MQIDLTKLSEVELKAMSYDELARIEQAQLNIRIIREELLKRVQPAKPVEVENAPNG